MQTAVSFRIDVVNVRQTEISEVMTKNCKTISPDMLAADALVMMETHKIWSLIVVNEHKYVMGIAHMHDLLNYLIHIE